MGPFFTNHLCKRAKSCQSSEGLLEGGEGGLDILLLLIEREALKRDGEAL